MKYIVDNVIDIDKLITHMTDNTNYSIYSKNEYIINECDKQIIITIIKESIPNWYNKKNYNLQYHCNKNINYYEIIICKIHLQSFTLITVNGEIKLFESFIKKEKYEYCDLDKLLDEDNNLSSLADIINYLKTVNFNELKKDIDTEIMKTIHDYELNEFKFDINICRSINNFNILFDNKVEWKTDDIKFDCNIDKFTDINGHEKISENKYNERICNDNKNYVLFDCKTKQTDGIEICDIYDKDKNAYIHNKRGTDYRLLITQCINAYLYITDANSFNKLKEKYNCLTTNTNIKIYAGIIDFSKQKRFATGKNKISDFKLKDKIIMGMAKDIIEKNNNTFNLIIIKSK